MVGMLVCCVFCQLKAFQVGVVYSCQNILSGQAVEIDGLAVIFSTGVILRFGQFYLLKLPPLFPR
jgi:hypothetical protein